MKTAEERFLEKVAHKSSDECWEWTAAKYKNGYGSFALMGKPFLAHRYSWIMHNNAEIPDGSQINHSCDNRSCVNPFHLKLGTHQSNMQEMKDRGRASRSSKPETKPRGDDHWSRKNPELVARGDNNGARKHIEKMSRGSKHGMAKLNECSVLEIKQYLKQNRTLADIAALFHVTRQAIWQIKAGRNWAHVS